MRILLNSHLKIKKAGWATLLLSVLLFSCKKEMSENERVGQFITDLLNSLLDKQIYSNKRNKIETANKIYGRKINLLLVVKEFTIKDIAKGKCFRRVERKNLRS